LSTVWQWRSPASHTPPEGALPPAPPRTAPRAAARSPGTAATAPAPATACRNRLRVSPATALSSTRSPSSPSAGMGPSGSECQGVRTRLLAVFTAALLLMAGTIAVIGAKADGPVGPALAAAAGQAPVF